jgi:CheY-like chemotaxis protein
MSRVLVVEDEAPVRNLITEVLEDEGYEVDEAVDGWAALTRVKEDAPDVIVLDLFTPRADGWEFLNLCRALPACAATPVVVVSASERIPADPRVRAFLRKPFDLDLLISTVASVLRPARPVA